ncbi:MAG: cytochrome c biogenesis heme-transporting ATPase CcmA [Pseudomonadota bacterium]
MTPLLEIEDLSVRRGERLLFAGLTETLAAGDVVHLRGPNGSGKTTLLRVVAGLTLPEAGAVRWRGADIDRDRQRYGQAMAWCGHKDGLKGDLTVRENLRFEQQLRGVRDPDAIERAARTLGLDGLMEQPCGLLSAGQRRRAALARLELAAATLWLLDEPFTNLDVDGAAGVAAMIGAHARAGGAAIVTAHGELPGAAGAARQLDLGAPA